MSVVLSTVCIMLYKLETMASYSLHNAATGVAQCDGHCSTCQYILYMLILPDVCCMMYVQCVYK